MSIFKKLNPVAKPFLSAAMLVCVCQSASAITPLDEKGMGDVSAETSSFVLDIYGKAAAGLSVEAESSEFSDALEGKVNIKKNQSAYKEGEDSIVLADEELSKRLTGVELATSQSPMLTSSTVKEVISATKQITQEAASFETNKTITFKPHGHHHESTVHDYNTVSVTRALHVELLEFERLRADEAEDGGFGNLYLSDWISQGTSTINARN